MDELTDIADGSGASGGNAPRRGREGSVSHAFIDEMESSDFLTSGSDPLQAQAERVVFERVERAERTTRASSVSPTVLPPDVSRPELSDDDEEDAVVRAAQTTDIASKML